MKTLAFQTRLDRSLQNMLDSVLVPGNSVVTTTASLDPLPTDPAAGEPVPSDDGNVGGVLGPDNIQIPENGQHIGKAVTETDTVRVSAPGVVKRLTIVVQINAAASDVDPAQVELLVGAAAGIDPSRGDTVKILT